MCKIDKNKTYLQECSVVKSMFGNYTKHCSFTWLIHAAVLY